MISNTNMANNTEMIIHIKNIWTVEHFEILEHVIKRCAAR